MFSLNNKKFIYFITLLIVGAFFIGDKADAYAPEPTHTALTEGAVNLFNQANEQQLGQEELGWLRQGTIEEDDAPRWLNHFFDPITGKGWTGENLKELPIATVLKAQKYLIGGKPYSAPEWFNDQPLQSSYDEYLGDQTFDRAVYEYVINNNKQDAFIAIGHILHLIQDMTVPAHTRQDTHSDDGLNDGDAYESWLKKDKKNSAINNFDEIIKDYVAFKCVDVKDCLYQLARYSNYYFFSKDTIDKKYDNPKVVFTKREIIDGMKINVGYGYDEKNEKIPLILYKNNIPLIDDSPLIHQSYYSRLSKKAVMGGAEVLRIFFEETAKTQAIVDRGGVFEKGRPLSPYQKIARKQVYSPLAEGLRLKSKAQEYAALAGRALKSIVFPFGAPSLGDIKGSQSVADNQNQNNNSSVDNDNLVNNLESEVDIIQEQPIVNQDVLASSLPASPLTNITEQTSDKIIIHSPYERGVNAIDKNENIDNSSNKQFGNNDIKPETAQKIVKENQEIVNPIIDWSSAKSDPGSALPFVLSYGQPATLNNLEDNAGNENNENAEQDNSDEQDNLEDSEENQNEDQNQEQDQDEDQDQTIDETAPYVEISLQNYSLSSTTLTVVWQSTSTDISFYEARYRQGGEGDWQNLMVSATSSPSVAQKVFQAQQDNTTYYFRVRATDISNNQSQWQEILAEISIKPIVINEIAWMGTGSSSQLSKDEWIELYNKSNQAVNLADWQLIGDNGGPDISFDSSDIISAKGYFLIERTDDDAVSDIEADFISSFGNGLNDEGEILQLKNAQGEIIDQVGSGGAWYAGHKDNRWTMERVNPYLAGNLEHNWKNNNDIIKNGIASDGQILIKGTPRQQNSVFNQNYAIAPYSWTNPQILESQWSPAGVGSPSIALDSQDNPHLIWKFGRTFGSMDVVYNFYNGSAWLNNEKFVTIGEWTRAASPAAHLVKSLSEQGQDNFAAVLTMGQYSPYSIYFNELNSGQTDWPKLGSAISNASTSAYYSSIAVDKANNFHIVWETNPPDSEIYYRYLDASASWSDIIKISSSSKIVYSPIVVVDNNSQPYIFWFEYGAPNSTSGIGLYVSTLINNSWSEPIKFLDYKGLGIIHPDSLAVVVDKNNRFHLVWSDIMNTETAGEIYYSYADNPLLSWSVPINISNSLADQSRAPKIIVDSQDNAHIVWAEKVSGKEQIFYSRYSAEQDPSTSSGRDGWTNPINVYLDGSKNFGFPDLAIDSIGQLHLVWSGGEQGQSSIYYSKAKP